jgi:hypothetical protein
VRSRVGLYVGRGSYIASFAAARFRLHARNAKPKNPTAARRARPTSADKTPMPALTPVLSAKTVSVVVAAAVAVMVAAGVLGVGSPVIPGASLPAMIENRSLFGPLPSATASCLRKNQQVLNSLFTLSSRRW